MPKRVLFDTYIRLFAICVCFGCGAELLAWIFRIFALILRRGFRTECERHDAEGVCTVRVKKTINQKINHKYLSVIKDFSMVIKYFFKKL